MNAIMIQNLKKNYGSFEVSLPRLDLRQGYVTGLVGKNGSGKTTLIRSVLGVIPKTAGTVQVLGGDITADPAIREQVGFVSETPYYIPTLTTEMVRTMNRDAIVFACANPTPEIFPDEAKAGGAKVVSTGRSDYPNQINNVLAFPGIFRGALDARASDINDAMKIAASHALADLVGDDLSADYIIPAAFDPRVRDAVATAVEQAARDSGVARV